MGSEIKIILYILIGFAYLFNRLYRKELSKSAQKKQASGPVNAKTSEEIFRELRKSLHLPGQAEEDIVNAAPLQRKPMRSKTAKPGDALKKQPRGLKVPAAQEAESGEFAPMEFDARKAMIFSEILKRPEY